MNRSERWAWFVVLFCLACGDSEDGVKDASPPDSGRDSETPAKLSTDLKGRVIDSAGNPLTGVAIRLANKTATSDADGMFALGMVPEGMEQMLVAERAGFSTGRMRIDVLGAAERQLITVTLQAAESAMLMNASQGGMAETESGTKIDFPANAFVDMNGKPVSGAVKVDVALVNDRDEIAAGPGGMIALAPQGTQGEETPLESFGMVEVKLTAGGQQVQLKAGVEVDLVFPLARNHGYKDGDPIALWYFDEAENHWVVRGEGIVEGDSFRAKVDHFSWWNADQVLTRSCIRGRLLDASGAPVGGARIQGEGRSYLGTSSVATGMDGKFCTYGRVSSALELSTTINVSGGTQVFAVGVNTKRSAGQCDNESSCLDLGDIKTVAEPLCKPAACPKDGDRVPCCRTDIGPCGFVVNGDCGGREDGSWDVPGEPGMMEIPGVPMGMNMTDAGAGGSGGGGSGGTDIPAAGSGGAGENGGGTGGMSGGTGGMSGGTGGTSGGTGGTSGGTGGTNGGTGGRSAGTGGVSAGTGGVSAGTGGSGGTGGTDVDRCASVTPATIGMLQGTTVGSTLLHDWWDGGSCYVNAPGYERTYSVTVPAHQLLRARATGNRARVAISTQCSAPNASCVNAGTEVGWDNTSADPVTVFVTVDSMTLDSMNAFSLALVLGQSDVCGDGLRANMACDDGNTSNGDGCSSSCQVESGWDCPPDSPCIQIVCGDGVIYAPGGQGESNPTDKDGCPTTSTKYEGCDDGDSTPGDGCGATCQIEPGYLCTGTPSVCSQHPIGAVCNKPLTLAAGTHDFATLEDNIDIQTNAGRELFLETALAPGSVLQVAGSSQFAGQAYVYEGDACGGSRRYDESFDIAAQQSFLIAYQRDRYIEGLEDATVTILFEAQAANEQGDLVISSVGTRAPGCGDGMKAENEGCDDGNTTAADGCNASCQTEAGYVCPDDKPCALAVCGNGKVEWPLETCDDGNVVDADGCSASCQEVPGQLCDFSKTPAVCVTRSQGDLCNNAIALGNVSSQSYAIDGFTHDQRLANTCAGGGPGCTPTRWFSVTQAAGQLTAIHVGNAQFEGYVWIRPDACDAQVISMGPSGGSGSVDAGDNHTSTSIGSGEDGLVYIRNESQTSRTIYFFVASQEAVTGSFELSVRTGAAGCGDGVVDAESPSAPEEQCDDMNTTDGDGCSASCKREAGAFECPHDGGPCSPVECGDGERFTQGNLAEECDDGNTTAGDGCSPDCTVEDGHGCWDVNGTSQCETKPAGALCDNASPLPIGASTQTLIGCPFPCVSGAERWWTTTLASGELLGVAASSTGVQAMAHLSVLGSSGCREAKEVDSMHIGPGTSAMEYRNPTANPLSVRVRIDMAEESGGDVQFTVVKAPLAGCGDGVVSYGEYCDDEDTTGGDGCSQGCVAEDGYACSGEPSVCVTALAGDLCNNASELTMSPQMFGLSGYAGEGPADPSRWVKLVVPARTALTGTVSTADISYGSVEIRSISGPDGCMGPSVSGQRPFGTSAPFVSSFANTANHPVTLALGISDGTQNPSTGSFSVSYTLEDIGCGDGYRDEQQEECDDGNTSSSDGCTAGCQAEPGYDCSSDSCEAVVCGDGERGLGETCDDGDSQSGDGCSSTCQVEPNYSCSNIGPSIPSVCVLRQAGDICSNALPLAASSWDLTDWNNDYFSGGPDIVLKATVQAGEMLALQGSAAFDTHVAIYEANELCMGGTNGAQQLASSFFNGGEPIAIQATSQSLHNASGPTELAIVIDGPQAGAGTFTLSSVKIAVPTCGDGVALTSVGEQCDDGNMVAGDGCAFCMREPGYFCPEGGTCHLVACGDGKIDPHSETCLADEQCDDGNTMAGDGCSASCSVEADHHCTGQPSVCVEVPPGDECLNAAALSNGQYSLTGFTEDTACDNVCGGADRWLSVSIPAGSLLIVDLQSSQGYPANPYARLFNVLGGCAEAYPIESAPVPFGQRRQLVYRNQSGSILNAGLALIDTQQSSSDLEFAVSYHITATPGCGDGYLDNNGDYGAYEQCDDGNASAADGCTACAIDADYTCNDSPSICEPI